MQASYPGVFIEEIPIRARAISGVATSGTAFMGRASRGPLGRAHRIRSYDEFELVYGGLSCDSMLGEAVRDFFAGGGVFAFVVRVHELPDRREVDLSALALSVGSLTDEI